MITWECWLLTSDIICRLLCTKRRQLVVFGVCVCVCVCVYVCMRVWRACVHWPCFLPFQRRQVRAPHDDQCLQREGDRIVNWGTNNRHSRSWRWLHKLNTLTKLLADEWYYICKCCCTIDLMEDQSRELQCYRVITFGQEKKYIMVINCWNLNWFVFGAWLTHAVMYTEKSVCVLVQPDNLVDYLTLGSIAAALSKIRIEIGLWYYRYCFWKSETFVTI